MNNFVAWKHGHVVAAVLSRAQLWQYTVYVHVQYCLPRYCDIDVLVLAVKPMVNSKGVTESPAMIQIDTRYSIHYYTNTIDNNQSVFIAVLRIRSIIVLATASAGL